MHFTIPLSPLLQLYLLVDFILLKNPKQTTNWKTLKGILKPSPLHNLHLSLPETAPSDLCSGWQQRGSPSQMGAAEDFGDQATSLQFWHLVVGGRFLPFTLKNVENHSSSVWRGIGSWLTLSCYMQMLRNDFPPTLVRTSLWTISQHAICHPEP